MSKKSKMLVVFLVDRSGSMIRDWKETIGMLNAYALNMYKRKNNKMKLHLNYRFFDTGDYYYANDGSQIIQDKGLIKKEKNWVALSDTDGSIAPRGGTPLYDALCQTMASIDLEKYDKVELVVMTDGMENASREHVDVNRVKEQIEEFQKMAVVTFLGANLQAFEQFKPLGILLKNSALYGSGNLNVVAQMSVDKSMRYATTTGRDAEQASWKGSERAAMSDENND